MVVKEHNEKKVTTKQNTYAKYEINHLYSLLQSQLLDILEYEMPI
jgi:hypothetical protein